MKSIFDIHDLRIGTDKKGFALQPQVSILFFCDSWLQDNSWAILVSEWVTYGGLRFG